MALMRAAAIKRVSQDSFYTLYEIMHWSILTSFVFVCSCFFLQLSEMVSATIKMVNAATAAMINARVYPPHLLHSRPFHQDRQKFRRTNPQYQLNHHHNLRRFLHLLLQFSHRRFHQSLLRLQTTLLFLMSLHWLSIPPHNPASAPCLLRHAYIWNPIHSPLVLLLLAQTITIFGQKIISFGAHKWQKIVFPGR